MKYKLGKNVQKGDKILLAGKWYQIEEKLDGCVSVDNGGQVAYGEEIEGWKRRGMDTEEYLEFTRSTERVMKYLYDYHNPHTIITINCNSAEILGGQRMHKTNKYIKD